MANKLVITPRTSLLPLLGPLTPPADLHTLDPHLFPEGPKPGDVIEVAGDSNSGKTALVVHLMAAALLPSSWRGMNFRGCGTGVIFLDCDLHFSIIHLENMMQKRIKQGLILGKDALKKKKLGQPYNEGLIDNAEELRSLLHSDKSTLKNDITGLVKQCLKSFYYLRCTSSQQYAITLLSMEEYLRDQVDISIIVIDSLSAFTWYDQVYRAKSWPKLKEYYNEMFTTVMAYVKKYNIVLVATKQAIFYKKLTDNYGDKYRNFRNYRGEDQMENEFTGNFWDLLGKVWASSVTYRLVMSTLNMGGSTERAASTSDNPNASTSTRVNTTSTNLNTSISASSRVSTTSTNFNTSTSTCSKEDANSSTANTSLNTSRNTSSLNTSHTTSSLNTSHNTSVDSKNVSSDSHRQLYSAEIATIHKKRKLIYTIHEDGLRWQNT